MNNIKIKNWFSFLCIVFSFGITIFRFIMAFVGFLYLLNNKDIYSNFPIVIIILIILFDQFDGKLFKKSILSDNKFWKDCRRILDSVCDRLCIQLFCIPILIFQPKFIFMYIIIMCKELMTSINCVKAYNNNIILSSNTAGKLSSVAIGIAVITWLLHLYLISYFIAPIILVTGYISCQNYLNSYKNKFNNTD